MVSLAEKQVLDDNYFGLFRAFGEARKSEKLEKSPFEVLCPWNCFSVFFLAQVCFA